MKKALCLVMIAIMMVATAATAMADPSMPSAMLAWIDGKLSNPPRGDKAQCQDFTRYFEIGRVRYREDVYRTWSSFFINSNGEAYLTATNYGDCIDRYKLTTKNVKTLDKKTGKYKWRLVSTWTFEKRYTVTSGTFTRYKHSADYNLD